MAVPALKDKTLLRSECYIGGEWQSAEDYSVIEVYNPADGPSRRSCHYHDR